MTMTPERFEMIVSAYGGSPARWPLEERDLALAYMRNNPAARSLVDDSITLDHLLDAWHVDGLTTLQQHVLVQTALVGESTFLDRVMDWLLPHSDRLLSWCWRPALAASLPLLCGLYLGTHFSFGIEAPSPTLETALSMVSLSDYTEPLE